MLPTSLPDSQTQFFLENGNVCIAFQHCENSVGIAARLADFLAPSFQIAGGHPHFDYSIGFEPYESFPETWKTVVLSELVIRRSTADLFNLKVNVSVWDENFIVVHDASKRTAYRINRHARHITAYVSEASFVHLVELIRYTCLIIEESRGSILLHASAAMVDGEAVLVLGQKGAGKTTTLLRLLLNEAFDYLSGDKVLIDSTTGGLRIRAWPDYPHIGIGSLRTYPVFASACGVDFFWEDGCEKPDNHKELIEPHVFRAALPGKPRRACGNVRAVLFPDISNSRLEVRQLRPDEQSLEVLRDNVEFPFEFTPGRWHGLFDDIMRRERVLDDTLLHRLMEVPWYSVLGPVVSPIRELSS